MLAGFVDLKHALTSLLSRPGYWLACVLTLGLGLGANIAIFALLQHVLLNPLPSPNLDRIVQVWTATHARPTDAGMSVLDYVDRRDTAGLEALALTHSVGLNFTGEQSTDRIEARRTTANLFDVLGVQPALGRVWSPDHETPGMDNVLILSNELWRTRFASDPNIVGRSVLIDGKSWRVIGVMPEGFFYPTPGTMAYVPFAFDPAWLREDMRGNVFANAIGLLADDAQALQVQTNLQSALQQQARQIPELQARIERDGARVAVQDMRDYQLQRAGGSLFVAQLAVLMVLLVAVANIAGLTLSQWLRQRRAFALRAALGASRWQLIRKLLAEAFWIAAAGVLAALVIGQLAIKGLQAILGPAAVRISGVEFDGLTLGVALLLGSAAAVLASIAPALAAARLVRTDELRAQGGDTPHVGRLRVLLVGMQVAFATALLCSAMLLARSMDRLLADTSGIATEKRLTARFNLPSSRYDTGAKQLEAMQLIAERLASAPGVADVGTIDMLPYSNQDRSSSFAIEGADDTGVAHHAHVRHIDPQWLPLVQTPILRGRNFDASDRLGSEPVVLIDQRLVDQHFRDQDPIGKRIAGVNGVTSTIVGVVASTRLISRERDSNKPVIYASIRQFPSADFGLTLHADASVSAALIQASVRAIDPGIAVHELKTMDALVASNLTGRRSAQIMLTTFALCALLMTAVGLYGTLALAVTSRKREFGVRLAIGADGHGLRRMMLLRALRIAAVGVGFGLLTAVGFMTVLSSLVADVRPDDLPAYVQALAVVLTTAFIASLLPAHRASRTDPTQCLRSE